MTDEQIIGELKEKHPDIADDVLQFIVWRASEFFEDCTYDFGVQHSFLPEGIIFGGTNRVVWTVRHGFRCDESYCSKEFIENFNRKQQS